MKPKHLITEAVTESSHQQLDRRNSVGRSGSSLSLVDQRREMKAGRAKVIDLNKKRAIIHASIRQDHNSNFRKICDEIETHADEYKQEIFTTRIES